MATLKKAHEQLFTRTPDEQFASLQSLWDHCCDTRRRSRELWPLPQELEACPDGDRLGLRVGEHGTHRLTNWSFSQLCQSAGVNRDTVNRLSPDTAARVFDETLASGRRPLQVFATDTLVRAIHGASYTRLDNVDLLTVVREFGTDFQPAQEAGGPEDRGGTGLYCGEQDMFVFLIDPLGWTEINGEAFAPGFFLWNSEVGRRSVGVQTFWFQAVCQNHIVWDAVEVVEYSRKHTANVHESLSDIRKVIEHLVGRRDERRDGFAATIRSAMNTRLGQDSEEALKLLSDRGIRRKLAEQALQLARQQGGLTIFAVVDALTRLAGQLQNAGERNEADAKASALLSLA